MYLNFFLKVQMYRHLLISSYHCPPIISRTSLSAFSSLVSKSKSLNSVSNSKPFILNYLIKACGLSETQALLASNRLPRITSPERFDSVLGILQQFGFNECHIMDTVRIFPPILLANVENTLKPKLELLHELGLRGSELALVVSKNPKLLTVNLNQRFIPCIEIFKKILSGDNRSLIKVLKGCKWIPYKDPSSRLLPNIAILESCGIVGSQLSMLLERQPTLFVMCESKLRDLVCRVTDIGFPVNSRMFVYALLTFSCMKEETLKQKFEFFRSYGVCEEDLKSMFLKSPSLFRTSEKKLRLAMEFFLNVIGIDLSVLVQSPNCLMHSLEKRLVPRNKVLQILKLKRLVKKEPNFLYLFMMSEAEFIKYILRFEEYSEELLVIYRGKTLEHFEDGEVPS